MDKDTDFFHLLNRGVDKRVVFQDSQDYLRFVRNLALLNTEESYPHNQWMVSHRMKNKPNSPLVTIHAYCLMPNHYHLLVSPVTEDGIAKFMKKVNMGYTKYFNERNKRTGALWQGKYKSIHLTQDAHFNYIPFYIHLNPLDICYPQWREGKVTSTPKALRYLQEYKWSSYPIFLEQKYRKNSLVEKSIFLKKSQQQSQFLNEVKSIISGNNSHLLQSNMIE